MNLTESKTNIKDRAIVIDGGALLHKVNWLIKVTYKDILNQYRNFVVKRYGDYSSRHVVFDGYKLDLSIKSQEQARCGSKQSPD